MSLFSELKRRNVFRVAVVYVVVAWLVMQVGEVMAPALRLPDWVNSVLAFFLILGFPVAVLFAWLYELTPEGLKRETQVDRDVSITRVTGRKLDRTVIVLLALALVWFGWDRYSGRQAAEQPGPTPTAAAPAAATEPGAPIADERESLAVLPFVNMSSDPEQDYFSDGLAEELLNLLAQVPELRVTSRTSAFSFKGKTFTIAEVGRELSVNHVLEGSVRKSGNKVRITAQLIKVATDEHLWSETWDRTLDDVFEIQDEIASAVVEALKLTLLKAAPRAIATDPQAYAEFLQARQMMAQRSAESLDRVELLLQQVLDTDPEYAPALTLMARVYMMRADSGLALPKDAYEHARELLNRALKANPDFPQAYAALSTIAINYDHDWASTAKYAQQALELNPDDSASLIAFADLRSTTGDCAGADEYARRAALVDPVLPPAHIYSGYIAMCLGDYDRAFDALEKALDLSPNAYGVHYYLSLPLIFSGRAAEALPLLEQETNPGFKATGLALAQYSLGDTAASDQAVAELTRRWANEGAYQIAEVHAWRGEIDQAFEWLDRAYENRDSGLTQILNDRALDALRDDPRMAAILERMGLDPAKQRKNT